MGFGYLNFPMSNNKQLVDIQLGWEFMLELVRQILYVSSVRLYFVFLNILCFGFLYYCTLCCQFYLSYFLFQIFCLKYTVLFTHRYIICCYTILYCTQVFCTIHYSSIFLYIFIYKQNTVLNAYTYITMSLFFFHLISINTKITNCSPTIYASHNVLHQGHIFCHLSARFFGFLSLLNRTHQDPWSQTAS